MGKMQRRHRMNVQALKENAAQHPRSGIQTSSRCSRVTPEHREVDLCMRIVRRHFAARNGDESHAGIPHFLRNQFREVACDLLADALSAAGFDILHKKFFQR